MTKRNFGSVRQLPSGRWQARYRNPQNNRLMGAPSTFATRKDADRWLANTQVDVDRGNWIDPAWGRVSLEEYAKAWLVQRILAPRTVELYEGLLKHHIEPILGNIDLGDLSPRDVRAWHAKLTKAPRPGPVTVAKAYRLLRAICETAVSDEVITRNPCKLKGASVEHSPERPVATVVQVGDLFNAIEDRYKAMVVLAAWCSLRLGEVLALTRADLDLAMHSVHVSKGASELRSGERIVGPPKTKAGVRTVAMPPHVMSSVVDHLQAFSGPAPDDLVFTGSDGGPLRRPTFYAAWDRATKATGLTHLRFHDLRHTGATWAAATGATTKELMSRLGHASADAALRYQHATAERDRTIAERLSELAKLPEAQ